jgi:phosphohistidine phosphatase
MQLFIMRHGHATWPQWEGRDDDRPLTPEGTRITRAEGEALARRGLKPDLILHSPLRRARETAQLLAEGLGCLDRVQKSNLLQPGLNYQRLAKILAEHAQLETLLIVGHAPDVAEVVEKLTGRVVRFKEGTIAQVEIESPEDAPQGKLVWSTTAELLIEDC